MVTYNTCMDAVFKALADQNRRKLLDLLFKKEGQTLGELCEPFARLMIRQAVMKHLRILEEANLVTVQWEGKEKFHFLNPVPINAIQERWIKKFEGHRLHALSVLKAALEDKKEKKK